MDRLMKEVEKEKQVMEESGGGVTLCGGEPLLHASFIHALRQEIESRVPFFLETNGTLAKQLESILPDIDIISMDIKLPSILKQPVWDEHKAFLALARQKDLYVKIVISAETGEEEFHHAITLLHDTAPDALLILQPVTPYGGVAACPPERVLAMQATALRELTDVRVIPQTHKMIGQL